MPPLLPLDANHSAIGHLLVGPTVEGDLRRTAGELSRMSRMPATVSHPGHCLIVSRHSLRRVVIGDCSSKELDHVAAPASRLPPLSYDVVGQTESSAMTHFRSFCFTHWTPARTPFVPAAARSCCSPPPSHNDRANILTFRCGRCGRSERFLQEKSRSSVRGRVGERMKREIASGTLNKTRLAILSVKGRSVMKTSVLRLHP